MQYGDSIVLSSSETTKNYFLAATSEKEDEIKYISENSSISKHFQTIDISLYPNPHELIFVIYPQFSYEARQQMIEHGIKDQNRALIERRLESETKLNNETLRKMKGSIVKYGDTIQLYNLLTSTFITLTNERKVHKGISFSKLVHHPEARSHIQIMPNNQFKKEGELISYQNRFKLICTESNSSFCFIENKRLKKAYQFRKKKIKEKLLSLNSENPKTKLKINLNQIPTFKNLPYCKNFDDFDLSDGFCSNINEHLSLVRFNNDLEMSTILKCFLVSSNSLVSQNNNLRYGDYVRMSMINGSYSTGYLLCETHFSGFHPEIMYRHSTKRQNDIDKNSTISSIFQLVPRNMSDYGKLLHVKDNLKSESSVHIRHFITGRFLHLGNSALGPHNSNESDDSFENQGEGNSQNSDDNSLNYNGQIMIRPTLSESFHKFAIDWFKNPENIKFFKDIEFEGDFSDDRMNKLRKKNITQACIDDYFDSFEVQVSRDKNIDSPVFDFDQRIHLKKNNRFSIKVNDKYDLNSMPIYDKECPFYNPSFQKLSIQKFTTQFIEIIDEKEDEADPMLLYQVDFDEIKEALSIVQLMRPLLKMIEMESYNMDSLQDGQDTIEELCYILVDVSVTLGEEDILIPRVQNAFRDLSVIDICIWFLYQYVAKDLKGNDYYENFLNCLIVLLEKSCKQNLLNSYYLFQWNELYIGLILNNIWKPNIHSLDEVCTIDIDQLISIIMKKNSFNSIVAKEFLPKVLDSIDFEKYELKTIQLLIDLFSSDGRNEMNMFGLARSKILMSSKFDRIFKPIIKDNGQFKIYLEDDDDDEECLNIQYLYQQLKEFQNLSLIRNEQLNNMRSIQKKLTYIEKTVILATNLCQGFSIIFQQRYSEFLSSDLAIDIILNNKIPPDIRAETLNYYKKAYLEGSCDSYLKKETQRYLWFKDKSGVSNTNSKFKTKRNQILVTLGLRRSKEIAMIPKLVEYFSDPYNCFKIRSDKYKFHQSMINLVGYLTDVNFFDHEELSKLKISLFMILKNLLSFRLCVSQAEDDYNQDFEDEDDIRQNSIKQSSTLNSFYTAGMMKLTNDDLQKTMISKSTLFLNKQNMYQDQDLNLISQVVNCLNQIESAISVFRIKMFIGEDGSDIVLKNERITNNLIKPVFNANRIANSLKRKGQTIADVKQSSEYLEKINSIYQKNISEILEDKLAKKAKYIYTLGIQYQSPSNHMYYLLIELICSENIKLAENCLLFLNSLVLQRVRFLKDISKLQVVYSSSCLEHLYQNFSTIHDNITRDLNRANRLQLQEAATYQIIEQFENINNHLTKLISQFIIPLSKLDSNKLKARQLYVDGLFTVTNMKELEVELNDGFFLSIFGDIYIDLDYLDLKQSLLNNSGIIQVLYDLLDKLQTMEISINTNKKKYNFYLEDHILFDTNEKYDSNQYLVREIGFKIIVMLTYCCLNNPKNQISVRNILYSDNNLDKMINIFTSKKNKVFSRYFFNFITSLYGTNLKLLLNMPSKDPHLIRQLIFILFSKLDPNNVHYFCIYLLTAMRPFISYKEMSINQNGFLLLTEFLRISQTARLKITRFFDSTLPKIFTQISLKSQTMKDGFPFLMKIEQGSHPKFISVPIGIIFAVQFLRIMGTLSKFANDEQMLQIQLWIPLNSLFQLLRTGEDWPSLVREIYIYITKIFLNQDTDYLDKIIISTKIVPFACTILEKMNLKIHKLNMSNQKTYFIEDYEPFPDNTIVDNTNTNYKDLNAVNSLILCRSMISEGLVPFLNKFINNLSFSNISAMRKTLLKMLDSLNEDSRTLRFMMIRHHNYGKLPQSLTDLNEIERAQIKSEKIEGAKNLKEKVINKINSKISMNLHHSSIKDSNLFFNYPAENSFEIIELNSSYYSYHLTYPGKALSKNGVCLPIVKKYHLYREIMSNEYYYSILEEDRENFFIILLGIKAESKLKLDVFIKMMLNVLVYDYNDREHKIIALKILIGLIETARNLDKNIVMDLVRLDGVRIICKVFVCNSDDEDLCSELIQLMLKVLEEEENEIQESFYRFLSENDINNAFMNRISEYINNKFYSLCSSEMLRVEVNSIFGTKEDFKADQDLVIEESKRLINNLIDCIEMMRLMCENHFSKLQNFLREQNQRNSKNIKSINMITLIAKIFSSFTEIIDDFNSILALKIFEFLIEMLQGPCPENQKEVCNSNLLSQVEELLTNLIQDSENSHQDIILGMSNTIAFQDSKFGSTTINRGISLFSSAFGTIKGAKDNNKELLKSQLRQYTISNLINNILTFTSAVTEATNDREVISKATFYTNQDTLLRRLKNIYSLFREDIERVSFNEINLENINKLKNKTNISQINQSAKPAYLTIKATLNLEGSNKINITPMRILIRNKNINSRDYNPIILEGIYIIILLKSLGDLEPSFAENLDKIINDISLEDQEFMAIFDFFDDKVSSIEIINMLNEIQRIYFPIHNITKYLSEYSKNVFDKFVPRDTPADKIRSLFIKFNDFYEEMKHFQRLNSIGFKIDLTYFSYLKAVSLILVILMNIIEVGFTKEDQTYYEDYYEYLVKGLSFTIMSIYVVIFGLWLVFNSYLDLRRTFEKRRSRYEADSLIKSDFNRSLSRILFFIDLSINFSTDSYLADLFINTSFAILGVTVSRLFLSFLLIDIIFQFELLMNVAKAISNNIKQLLMTCLLFAAILNIYASYSYFINNPKGQTFVFIEAPDFKICVDYLSCFLAVSGFGLRSGGGIGEVLRYPDFQTETSFYNSAVSYDFSFFVIINLILFNIFSGIIIDTFGDLRQKKTRNGNIHVNYLDYDRKFKCFICNLGNTQFSKKGLDFKDHTENEHNEWSYINFVTHLNEVNQSDQNGTESYVYGKMVNQKMIDISWVPIGKSKSLKQKQNKQESKEEILRNFFSRIKMKIEKTTGVEISNNDIIDFIDKLNFDN